MRGIMLQFLNSKIDLTLVGVFLSFTLLYSHSRDPMFEQISIDQGLSHPAVTSLLQDSQGFLWFGTQDGLNRYDGYNILIFKHDPYDSTSISHNGITSLAKVGAHSIWVATNNGVLNKYDKLTGTFKRFTLHLENNAQAGNIRINSLYTSSDSMVCVGTNLGLIVFDPGREIYHNIDFSPKENDLSLIEVLSIKEDKDSCLWIGTNKKGVYKFDKKTGESVNYLFHQKNEEINTIKSILVDETEQLWFGTNGAGLLRFNKNTGIYVLFKNNDPSLPIEGSNKILDIIQDHDGDYWIGTGGGGINQFEPASGLFIPHKCETYTICCLGNNFINALLCDETGNVWLATDCCGINKHVKSRLAQNLIPEDLKLTFPFSDSRIWAVLEDSDGLVWIATSEGLIEYDPERRWLFHHRHERFDETTLGSNAVTVLFEDSKKNLWVGTEDGLDLFSKSSRTFTQFHFGQNSPNSLSDIGIVSICEDKNGNLWIGSKLGGLTKFNFENKKVARFAHNPDDPSSISNTAIMAIPPIRIIFYGLVHTMEAC